MFATLSRATRSFPTRVKLSVSGPWRALVYTSNACGCRGSKHRLLYKRPLSIRCASNLCLDATTDDTQFGRIGKRVAFLSSRGAGKCGVTRHVSGESNRKLSLARCP